MNRVIASHSNLLSTVTVAMAAVRRRKNNLIIYEDFLKFFPSLVHPFFFFIFPSPRHFFSLSFDAFDDILSFISYKWLLIKLASMSTEFPQWFHREKPKSPQSLATTFSQRRIAFLWHQVNQMQLQGVWVRKSKFYTAIEFYIYRISLSIDGFRDVYSYFLWLHYVWQNESYAFHRLVPQCELVIRKKTKRKLFIWL